MEYLEFVEIGERQIYIWNREKNSIHLAELQHTSSNSWNSWLLINVQDPKIYFSASCIDQIRKKIKKLNKKNSKDCDSYKSRNLEFLGKDRKCVEIWNKNGKKAPLHLGDLEYIRVGAWMSWCLTNVKNSWDFFSSSCLDQIRAEIRKLNAESMKGGLN